MKLQIAKGSTSQIVTVFIQDSSSAVGAGLGSLDESSSIVGGYVRAGGTGLVLAVDENVTTEGTYQAPSTDNQVRIGTPANMTTGTYELHFHNDLFATGADSVFITLGGATDMAPLVIEIQVTDWDPNSATAWPNFVLQYNTIGLTGDTFPATQSQVTGIANTGSAVHEPVVLSPGGFTLNTGTNEQNNEDATRALDGTEHQWDSTGNAMDGRYLFDLGGVAVPTELTILGRLNGAGGDEVQVNVNTGTVASPVFTPSLNQRGSINRQGSSTNTTRTFTLFATDLMTGADAGKVQIQIVNDGTVTGATFSVEQMFCSKSSIADPTGYSLGSIWYDDTANNTNTVVDVDGTARNPVSTWAAVLTLNGQLGFKKMQIANGSTVQLSGTSDNFSLEGEAWTLQLNAQSIVNMHVRGATVTGTSTGSGSDFHDCDMGTCTIAPCNIIDSRFTSKTGGGFTMQTAGDYTFHACASMVAGNDSPVFTFPAAGNTFISDRAGSGGRQYEGMSAGDLASIEGWGQFIEGTCTGGAVTIRGCLTLSGVTNITITDGARYDVDQVGDAVWDELLAGHTTEDTFGNVWNDLTVENATSGLYQFTAAALENGPTIAAAAASSQGAVDEFNLTAYQYAVLGPFVFTASNSQQGDDHVMTCYTVEAPATIVFEIPTGNITVSGSGFTTITVSQDDTNTATARTLKYILRNTTDDTVIATGALCIEENPDVSP